MGRYIDDTLQLGEKVLYSTNAHWIFYLPAISAWILALILFVLSRQMTTDSGVPACLAAAAVVALDWTFRTWFHRWIVATGVTIMGVGEGHKAIKTIASPLEFRNYNTAR
jgi:hypothetical protein